MPFTGISGPRTASFSPLPPAAAAGTARASDFAPASIQAAMRATSSFLSAPPGGMAGFGAAPTIAGAVMQRRVIARRMSGPDGRYEMGSGASSFGVHDSSGGLHRPGSAMVTALGGAPHAGKMPAPPVWLRFRVFLVVP